MTSKTDNKNLDEADAQQQLIRGYVDDKQELEERAADQAQEIERLRAALRAIAELDPDKDSDEGYNEWGQADCFEKAQELANAAISQRGHDA